MEILKIILLVLHLIGTAALLGGFMAQIKNLKSGTAEVTAGMLHGALLQLVTGLLLVGVTTMTGYAPDHVKIAVKTVVLVVILLLVVAYRKKETAPSGVVGAIGGLTLLNIILAVAWQ